LAKISRNPWSLLSVIDEKQSFKDIITRFITLGNMIYNLRQRKGPSPFDEYPFNFEGRDVYSWNLNDIIVVDEDKTLVY